MGKDNKPQKAADKAVKNLVAETKAAVQTLSISGVLGGKPAMDIAAKNMVQSGTASKKAVKIAEGRTSVQNAAKQVAVQAFGKTAQGLPSIPSGPWVANKPVTITVTGSVNPAATIKLPSNLGQIASALNRSSWPSGTQGGYGATR